MSRILIVEDEPAISNLIDINLSDAGYNCEVANDGLVAIDLLRQKNYDLVLLDIMLPGADGYELLELAKDKQAPVIFVTAKGSLDDKVSGLKGGAEDYLTKPFSIVELLARVEVVLRRFQKEKVIEIEGLKIDREARLVQGSDDKTINLTKTEFDLLLLFVTNRNIALFKDVIYQRVWGDEYIGESRTVDLHVQRLRKKLNWEDKIATVHGVGYRLEENEIS